MSITLPVQGLGCVRSWWPRLLDTHVNRTTCSGIRVCQKLVATPTRHSMSIDLPVQGSGCVRSWWPRPPCSRWGQRPRTLPPSCAGSTVSTRTTTGPAWCGVTCWPSTIRVAAARWALSTTKQRSSTPSSGAVSYLCRGLLFVVFFLNTALFIKPKYFLRKQNKQKRVWLHLYQMVSLGVLCLLFHYCRPSLLWNNHLLIAFPLCFKGSLSWELIHLIHCITRSLQCCCCYQKWECLSWRCIDVCFCVHRAGWRDCLSWRCTDVCFCVHRAGWRDCLSWRCIDVCFCVHRAGWRDCLFWRCTDVCFCVHRAGWRDCLSWRLYRCVFFVHRAGWRDCLFWRCTDVCFCVHRAGWRDCKVYEWWTLPSCQPSPPATLTLPSSWSPRRLLTSSRPHTLTFKLCIPRKGLTACIKRDVEFKKNKKFKACRRDQIKHFRLKFLFQNGQLVFYSVCKFGSAGVRLLCFAWMRCSSAVWDVIKDHGGSDTHWQVACMWLDDSVHWQ